MSKSATGTIFFDNEKHRLDHSEAKLNLEGKLDIDVGGTSTQVNLTMEQTTVVKMSDTNPVPTAKKS